MQAGKERKTRKPARIRERAVREIGREGTRRIRNGREKAAEEKPPFLYAEEQAEEAGHAAIREGAGAAQAAGKAAVLRVRSRNGPRTRGREEARPGTAEEPEQDRYCRQGGRKLAEEQAKRNAEERAEGRNAHAAAEVEDPGTGGEGISGETPLPPEDPGRHLGRVRRGPGREPGSSAGPEKRETGSGEGKERKRTVKTREAGGKQRAERAPGREGRKARTAARTEEQGRILLIRKRKSEASAWRKAGRKLAKAVGRLLTETKTALLTAAMVLLGVLLLVLLTGGIGMVLNSAFGIIWADGSEEGRPLPSIIARIDAEHLSGIDEQIRELAGEAEGGVRVVYAGDNDGDSAAVNNWNDVLAVYAVLETTDEVDPTEVISVTDRTEAQLREVFRFMNKVKVELEEPEPAGTGEDVPPGTEGGSPEAPEAGPVTVTVTQSPMTWREAAWAYGFTEYQYGILEELMKPEYYEYFARLAGVDILGGADLTQILSGLPESSRGADLVRAAVQYLGAPYVWGAKGPDRFDCSGFVHQAAADLDPGLGESLRTNAAGQAKYCYDRGLAVGQSELLPGDLVFWQNLGCPGCTRWNEIHHVGIYMGNGKVIEASSGKGRVVIRDLWTKTNYPLYMFGRVTG